MTSSNLQYRILTTLPERMIAAAMTPGGTNWLYIPIDESAQSTRMVMSGERTLTFETVGAAGFAPDGRLYYSERKGKKWRYVIGDRPDPWFAQTSHISFSPDGKKVAYSGLIKKDANALILNGEPRSAEFVNLSSITWSPDGSSFAFHAGDGKESFVVLNSERQPPCRRILGGVFSLDSKHFAYAAEVTPGRYRIVHDGQQGEETGQITAFGYTSRGELWYIHRSPPPTRQPKYWIFVGNQRIETQHLAWHACFDAEGKLAAYVTQDERASLIANGQTIDQLPRVRRLLFSPLDRLAAIVDTTPPGTSTPTMAIYYQGALTDSFHAVFHPAFSVDGTLSFGSSKKGAELRWNQISSSTLAA